MPKVSPPNRLERFYAAWLAALALAVLFFLWAYARLSPEHDSPFALSGTTAPAPKAMKKPIAPAAPATFNPEKDAHLVTAFSLQGMRHVTDAEPAFTLLPPGNTLVAQVIRRAPSPQPLLAGNGNATAAVLYTLEYAPDPALFPDTVPARGRLDGSGDGPWFANDSIVVLPYIAGKAMLPGKNGTAGAEGANKAGGKNGRDGSGMFYAYPTARVTAVDAAGAVLVETRAVLPVSTETGCRNCHTGPWKYHDTAGISAQTAEHILAVHDRRNRTRLAEQAGHGESVDCRSCHSGAGKQPNLSTALHGFHATMKLEGAKACGACHPSSPTGATRFYRDIHAMWGLDCTRCHGAMTEHALSLLRFEAERGSAAAATRMALLEPTGSIAAADIRPRKPGVNLPHCSGCHDFKKKPDPSTASAFNKWTKDRAGRFSLAVDNTGALRCPSCHGSPHAVYPADGPAGDDDNFQPLQYQKASMPLGREGNCSVCHTVDMDYFIHHDRVE